MDISESHNEWFWRPNGFEYRKEGGLARIKKVLDDLRSYIGDALVAIEDFERFRVEARAVACRAGAVDAGKEEEFDANESLSSASFTAALRHVEGKLASVILAGPRKSGGCEELADVVEQAGVCCHVGARRAANGPLVDDDETANVFYAGNYFAVGSVEDGLFQIASFIFLDFKLLPEVRWVTAYRCRRRAKTFRNRRRR